MRLLFVNSALDVGGSQSATVQLARSLAAQGCSVGIAASEPFEYEIEESDRLRLFVLHHSKVPLHRSHQIARVADMFAPDVIVAVEAATIPSCLVAGVRSDTAVASYILGPRIPWHIPDRTDVWVASPDLFDFSQLWRKATTRLLKPPISIPPYEERPETRTDRVRVLSVGRLIEQYKGSGLLTLIRSATHLPGGSIEIVGDGPFRSQLETEASRVNAELGRAAVVFHGSQPDPSRYYANVDVVVGGGLSAIEAVACGVPTVVLGRNGFAAPVTVGALDEMVQHGFFGATGSYDDPASLAALVAETARSRSPDELAAAVRRIYGGDGAAEKLQADLSSIEPHLPTAADVFRSGVQRGHYRLRRRAIFEVERRRGNNVDEIENVVNRRIRSYPLRSSGALATFPTNAYRPMEPSGGGLKSQEGKQI